MTRIYTSGLTQPQAEGCYAAFLTGSLPKEGCLIVSGPHAYFVKEKPALPESAGIAVDFGPVDIISSSLGNEMKSIAAYREYVNCRRLPVRSSLLASPDGITVFPEDAYDPDLMDFDMFRLSFHPLDEVMTPQEAAQLCHVDAKRIQSDCERGGIFTPGEARHSGNAWLVLASAALKVYQGKEEKSFAVNPLLLVYSSVEAAHIWNRESGTVRAAAGGAGHAAARMNDEDRRKSGRTWLIRRQAMERLFGQPVPDRLKASFMGLV